MFENYKDWAISSQNSFETTNKVHRLSKAVSNMLTNVTICDKIE